MPLNILITGASGGFGNLTTLALLQRGHSVFASMRGTTEKNQDAAEALVAEASPLKGQLAVVELGVTDDRAVAAVTQRLARLPTKESHNRAPDHCEARRVSR